MGVHYPLLKAYFKGDKMLKKLDIDKFEATILGLIATLFIAIVVEMFIGIFK